VLVVAQRPSDYVEMRRCALALHDLGWTAQILYFGNGPQDKEERKVAADMEGLHRAGKVSQIEFLVYGGRSSRAEEAGSPPRESLRKMLRRVIYRLLGISPSTSVKCLDRIADLVALARAFAHPIYAYRRNLNDISDILKRLKPDAIVLPEDVVGPVTALVIKAGHRRGIPSIILPYTIANQQEAFRSLTSNPSYHFSPWSNRIVGSMFRRWIMRQNGVALVRMPAPYIIGHIMTRTVPPDPWMMNSGFANVIAVENRAMLDYYVAAGIPRGKMEVVGAIYDDQLAKFKLNKDGELRILRAELGMSTGKPLLVVGGCPDQSMSCPAGFEFADMDDFCQQLAQSLKPLQADYEIVVRPHPNCLRMGDVLAREGIRSTLTDTARLVALSDVYIAFASATIRWAIACGVPTINYDVFHYDYDDFRGIEGVVNVDRFDRFRQSIGQLLPGSAELDALWSGMSRSAARWGCLDGRSTTRIAALIDRLCRLERVPRTCY
jgi:hypothetical protein